jgi:signal peptidase I
MQQRKASSRPMGITQVDCGDIEPSAKLLMQPWWLDWTAGLFPVICVVFLLRSFCSSRSRFPQAR